MIDLGNYVSRQKYLTWYPWFQTALLSVRQLGSILCSPLHIQCCWRLQVKPECWNVGLLLTLFNKGHYYTVTSSKLLVSSSSQLLSDLPVSFHYFSHCLIRQHSRSTSCQRKQQMLSGRSYKWFEGERKELNSHRWSGRGFHTWPVTESHSITVEINNNKEIINTVSLKCAQMRWSHRPKTL